MQVGISNSSPSTVTILVAMIYIIWDWAAISALWTREWHQDG